MNKTNKRIVLITGLIVVLAGLLLANYSVNYYHTPPDYIDNYFLNEKEFREFVEAYELPTEEQERFVVVPVRPYVTYGMLLIFIGLVLLVLPQLFSSSLCHRE